MNASHPTLLTAACLRLQERKRVPGRPRRSYFRLYVLPVPRTLVLDILEHGLPDLGVESPRGWPWRARRLSEELFLREEAVVNSRRVSLIADRKICWRELRLGWAQFSQLHLCEAGASRKLHGIDPNRRRRRGVECILKRSFPRLSSKYRKAEVYEVHIGSSDGSNEQHWNGTAGDD